MERILKALVFVRDTLETIPVTGGVNLKRAYDSINNLNLLIGLVNSGEIVYKSAEDANGDNG